MIIGLVLGLVVGMPFGFGLALLIDGQVRQRSARCRTQGIGIVTNNEGMRL